MPDAAVYTAPEIEKFVFPFNVARKRHVFPTPSVALHSQRKDFLADAASKSTDARAVDSLRVLTVSFGCVRAATCVGLSARLPSIVLPRDPFRMTNPRNDQAPDRATQLERELDELSKLLKKTQRDLGAVQWTLSLLIIGLFACVFLVRSQIVDPKLVFGSPMPKTLESKNFGLYNRHGQRVMFAQDDKWGYPNILFFDLKLDCKMGVFVYPEDGGSAGIAFYDKSGTRADFRMGENGEALVHLMGEKKRGGILMAVARDGTPSLTMTDKSGKVLFQAPTWVTAPPPPKEQRR
jgi:hypothetical protein